MSNQHTGLPNTAEEIRAFIGMQFSSLQFGQENEQPHEDDSYTLTAHDLISAFQWLEIHAHVSAEPVAWVRRHPDGALTAEFLEHAVIEPVRKSSGAWVPLYTAPVAAQPDVTQQTLDDVKAGIPARDAEIEALRKEIDILLAQQDADKVDTALAEMVHAMFRSGNSVPVTRITIDRKQYEAAIDAARKEQA